ncbi:MAG: 50S ribosomal protein L21 [Endomicrobium sp.]|jgi:large subunit ribosomal protein L21|nr:50S ribosomal protein L21 [Endomicrobium sp.]
MYAIIKTGGKQYKVEEGLSLVIEKLDEAEVGQEIILDQVLLFADGNKTMIGKPIVEGAKVLATVVAQKRASKVLVFKRKPKKGYKKLQGHRQYMTEIKVTELAFK